ncbi:DMT family transporter [Amphritea balenae]|uniref:DMT family transporter n=1 Tax=Amphritea balenae TaxID=452629 RepID=A0A3P1SWN8_9GAMM|nr:DMT family transporter [Amphritea balenae]RRD01395.1 DMT family transporter [Amphritea balenae]GGK57438.1 membrane protein [Amphritea balenae]
MNWFLLLGAIAVGAVIPVQGALNARLGAELIHPMQATLVSYIGGTLACILALVVVQASLPDWKRLVGIDWYLYCGGFLGVIFVSGMLYLMPKIGIANMLAAAILGQLVMSLIFDHFGFFGGLVIEVTPSRIFGVLLLLLGLYFIQR